MINSVYMKYEYNTEYYMLYVILYYMSKRKLRIFIFKFCLYVRSVSISKALDIS